MAAWRRCISSRRDVLDVLGKPPLVAKAVLDARTAVAVELVFGLA
jgi:hypothetical protein